MFSEDVREMRPPEITHGGRNTCRSLTIFHCQIPWMNTGERRMSYRLELCPVMARPKGSQYEIIEWTRARLAWWKSRGEPVHGFASDSGLRHPSMTQCFCAPRTPRHKHSRNIYSEHGLVV